MSRILVYKCALRILSLLRYVVSSQLFGMKKWFYFSSLVFFLRRVNYACLSFNKWIHIMKVCLIHLRSHAQHVLSVHTTWRMTNGVPLLFIVALLHIHFWVPQDLQQYLICKEVLQFPVKVTQKIFAVQCLFFIILTEFGTCQCSSFTIQVGNTTLGACKSKFKRYYWCYTEEDKDGGCRDRTYGEETGRHWSWSACYS